jgi:hypothetical protein
MSNRLGQDGRDGQDDLTPLKGTAHTKQTKETKSDLALISNPVREIGRGAENAGNFKDKTWRQDLRD